MILVIRPAWGRLAASLAAIALVCGATAHAQVIRSSPQPTPLPAPIEAPRDVPYPGLLRLEIDATDLDHRLFRVNETIPLAKAGPMTLLYAQWVPGGHAPRAPLYSFVGLKITAEGRPVPWTRDPVDVFAYHIDVPTGAAELKIEAQYLTPVEAAQGGFAMTPEILRLYWFNAALYPAGHFTRQIQIQAQIKLPPGWDYGTALETASKDGDVVTFKPESYETIADSPLIAGKHFRKYDLDPKGRSRVTLNVAGDKAADIDAKPDQIETLREVVRQMDKLYGARHYNHYDFLLTVSDKIAGMGLEHQRSSDNGVTSGYFTKWSTDFISRDLLAHEYNHSWNGKYRRGADLWTPNFNVPMRNSSLWVYEGQTQFWGNMIAARSGLITRQQALDQLAAVAASYDEGQPGRDWRPLIDTTNDPIISGRRAQPWNNYARSEDYYREGQMIWLDADTLIRERSKNKRSLDDFARAFFGVNDGDWGQLTFTFDDVVATLNKVEPYDWARFLKDRLEGVHTDVQGGIKRGGYKLVYGEERTELLKAQEGRSKAISLSYSIGAAFDSTGKITAVQWDGPVFRAGLVTGLTVLSVNGQAFDGDKLREAVKATKSGQPLEFLVRQGDAFNTLKIDYKGGLRYPRLERIEGTPDYIGDLITRK